MVRIAMEPKESSHPKIPHNPGVGRLIRDKRAHANPLSEADIDRGFLGWHENGYLPHRDEPGLVQFVTFRLADAFPSSLRHEWEWLLQIEDDRKRRLELEAYLDRGRGECFLNDSAIAKLVENALLFFEGERYQIRAWVVMPNHVHAVFLVGNSFPLWRIMDSWKSYISHKANKLLNRSGRFWQAGYWDTYMRDSDHEMKSRRYTENNPVKARLVNEARAWPWSSARFRDPFGNLMLPERTMPKD